MKKKRNRFIPFIIICLSLFLSGCVGTFFWAYLLTRPTADIRPGKIKLSKKATQVDTLRGGQVFDKILEAYEVQRWQQVDSYRVELQAQFYSFAGKVFNPFPDNQTHLSVMYYPDSAYLKAEVLSGKWKGRRWELKGETLYIFKPGQEKVKSTTKGNPLHPVNRKRKTVYWLRHFQTLIELPMQLQDYPLTSLIDTVTIKQQNYLRLLVSRDQAARDKQFNQFILYLNPKTFRIGKMAFTTRKLSKALAGRAEIQKTESFNQIPIISELKADFYGREKLFYQFEIKSVEFFQSK